MRVNRTQALEQLQALKVYAQPQLLAAGPWPEPWQNLIATLLSARTRDDITIPVAKALFQRFPILQQLATAPLEEIEEVIRPINYYATKAQRVQACARILIEQFQGQVPMTLEELVSLPGVGRKTANVFLSEAGADAIGVDTHVARIAQKLGWTTSSDPYQIELDLQELFPRHIWSQINNTLVQFGRTYRGSQEDQVLEGLRHPTPDPSSREG